MSSSPQYTVGIVGARGHTGAELIKLIAAHPNLQLGFVSSRELAGQRVADHHPTWSRALPCCSKTSTPTRSLPRAWTR